MDKMRISYGGFVAENIREWILEMALGTGNPDDWFRAMAEVVDEMSAEYVRGELPWQGEGEGVSE